MQNLKISITEWSFLKPAYDVAAFYQSVAALGITGAEIVKKEHYAAARGAGLKLINRMGPGKWNRVENHAKCLEDLSVALDDAVANDIPDIFVFSGNRAGQADDVSIAHCITGLTQAAALARDAGKRLIFEVFNKHDHPDYAADSSDFAYQVVRGVNSPHVTVLYDIYHMLKMEEDVDRTLFDHLDLVGHIHIARSPDRKIATDAKSIQLIHALKKSPYKGYIGAEWLAADSVNELREFMDAIS